jgi:hypothetical protein
MFLFGESLLCSVFIFSDRDSQLNFNVLTGVLFPCSIHLSLISPYIYLIQTKQQKILQLIKSKLPLWASSPSELK